MYNLSVLLISTVLVLAAVPQANALTTVFGSQFPSAAPDGSSTQIIQVCDQDGCRSVLIMR